MNPFLESILQSVLGGSAKTTAGAIESGASWQTVGISAAAGALAGLLQAILAHPAAALPAPKPTPTFGV
jgi:hypothetical protein